MIRIGCPYIEEREGRVCLVSNVQNEGENRFQELFFSVEKDYSEYLVSETADAFVVALILRAIVSRQDIAVEAPLSEKLFHNLQNAVFYAVAKCCYGKGNGNDDVIIPSLKCQGVLSIKYDSRGVGTGCSLGVDSFSVIKKYFLDADSTRFPSYRITHLACFNVGAFGSDDTEMTRNSFFHEVEEVRSFGNLIGLPIVSVDTNIHSFYPEHDFNWSHTYLNMGCVLALQKLWGKYLYATGYSLDFFSWDIHDSAKYEFFLLPNISTESTELISVDMDKGRSEKVRFIADDSIVQANLNVCLKEQRINNGRIQRSEVSDYRNCGVCEKCLRTILQLDVFGKLHLFKDVFDLSRWEDNRGPYLRKIVLNKDKNSMYKDIYRTIHQYGYGKGIIEQMKTTPESSSIMKILLTKGKRKIQYGWEQFLFLLRKTPK